ncbi:phosphate regulon sensor histidine kinase PhoR [Peptococcaceae bacterium]|nr:phosphate regulon sensor histidine kinase PhoR [Peptococcaceae bacterium]
MFKPGMKSYTIAGYIILLMIFIVTLVLEEKEIISFIWVIVIAITAIGIIAYFTVVRLVGPLEEIKVMTSEMAAGVLEKEIVIQSNNEMDELATSINFLAQQLRQNMVRISEERNRAKAILNSMGDGVIALDDQGRILMINPILEKTFKIDTQTSSGKKSIEIIRNYELDQLLRQVLRDKQPLSCEIKFLMPRPKVFKVYATPLIGNDDCMVGVVALMHDITERRQLENMRSEFVANVSHELRTPLTSISGFLETLLDGAVEDAQTTTRFLEIMKQETNRLTRLVDDLLKLSKLEDQKITFKKQPINISKVIYQTVQTFKPQAAEKDIQLHLTIADKIPQIKGDKDLIMQVMVNLVDNAIKYTPSGGKVAIKAGVVSENIEVAVQNSGLGIPKESLPRVFERFYRVDKARSRDAGGTGLGLAIVKHVIELHGGRIQVKSSSKGTTFTFRLPLK